MKIKIPPALVLFFLAPATGELLSGSTPPLYFFTPFTLLLLGALYGGGAILVREMALRMGKRWPSILLLGAAYGIVEEGLMVKSFFDPHWVDIGTLGSFGRWGGVNWVWTVELTIFHAIVSIAIPILLTELIFPAQRDQSWVSGKWKTALTLLFWADVAVGFLWLTPYRPPLLPYLGAALAVAGLYFLARLLPARWWTPRPGKIHRPFWFWLLGFAATFAFFIVNWNLTESGIPAIGVIALALSLLAVVYQVVKWMSSAGAWDDRHRLALAGGVIGFFTLFFAPIVELNQLGPEDPAGLIVTGLAAMALLFLLGRKIRKTSAA